MKHVPRIYLPGRMGPGLRVVDGEAARHLHMVLRVRPGDPVLVFPGDGQEWHATVAAAAREQVSLDVTSIARQEAPAEVVLEVGIGMVKPARFEEALEGCTEAGADIIRPLVTDYTGRADAPSAARTARWDRIVVEAAEQSGRLYVPVIEPPISLARYLATGRRTIVFGDREGHPAAGLAGLLPSRGTVAWVTGPEGGFSPEELSALRSAGGLPLRLGPYILRTETASVVGAAVLRSLAG